MIGEGQLHCVHHDVAVRAAVAPEDPVGEKLSARSDAHDLTVVRVTPAVCCGDARYVRAVGGVGGAGAKDFRPVGDVGIAGKRIGIRMRYRVESRTRGRVVGVADQVESAAHLAARTEATAELWQRVVETAVHDRDRHARAVEPELCLGDVSACEPDRILQIDVVVGGVLGWRKRQRLDRIDRFDAGDRAESSDLRRCHRHRETVPERVVRVALGQLDADCSRIGLERVAFGLERRFARPLHRRRA